MFRGTVLVALASLLVASTAADEARCPLDGAAHDAMIRRYREVTGALAARITFPEFDPYAPQRRFARLPDASEYVRGEPEFIGIDQDGLRMWPREPRFISHLMSEGYTGPRDTHVIIGPIGMNIVPSTRAVQSYENGALGTYLAFKLDRFLTGKGKKPECRLTKEEAFARCKSYLRIILRRSVDDLVPLEGPFYDEPEPNYRSTHRTACDRAQRCWPQWDVRLWRAAGGVVTGDHVASCIFDPDLGPTHLWTNYDPDKPLPSPKPRVSKEAAEKIASRAAEPLAPQAMFDLERFHKPVLRRLWLVYADPPSSWDRNLADHVGPLPIGLTFSRHEGTPLVWRALFELRGREDRTAPVLTQGVHEMWIDIDAQTGNLLAIDAREKSKP